MGNEGSKYDVPEYETNLVIPPTLKYTLDQQCEDLTGELGSNSMVGSFNEVCGTLNCFLPSAQDWYSYHRVVPDFTKCGTRQVKCMLVSVQGIYPFPLKSMQKCFTLSYEIFLKHCIIYRWNTYSY